MAAGLLKTKKRKKFGSGFDNSENRGILKSTSPKPEGIPGGAAGLKEKRKKFESEVDKVGNDAKLNFMPLLIE